MTSDTFFPRVGGAEMHVLNIATRLHEAGHDVTLLEAEPSKGQPDPALLPGVRVIHIPWRKGNVPRLLSALWRDARHADIIHAHYSYRLAVLAGIVGRLRRVPVVVTLHGTGTLDIPGARLAHRILHRCYRLASLRLASLVISTSEDLALVARRAVPRLLLTVIPNGFDERRFSPGAPPPELAERYRGRRLILTVRRLVPKNGVQYLVEALPAIVAKVPDALLVCLGDGRLRESIRERARALGVEAHVELLGMVANEMVPGYLRLADVVVFPSTAESSSIACAEAMASGLPVVASRVGGLIELLRENQERGRLVRLVDWETSDYDAPRVLPPERYGALAEATIGALRDPSPETRDAALAFAREHLGWNVIAKRTEEAYRGLVRYG